MSKQTEKIKELVAKREQARLGGGEKAIEKQHQRGKYTARERIDIMDFLSLRLIADSDQYIHIPHGTVCYLVIDRIGVFFQITAYCLC